MAMIRDYVIAVAMLAAVAFSGFIAGVHYASNQRGFIGCVNGEFVMRNFTIDTMGLDVSHPILDVNGVHCAGSLPPPKCPEGEGRPCT